MSIKPGKARLGHPDQQTLIYAAVFMVCAIVSAYGAGAAALIGFVPAVAAIGALLRRLRRPA